MRNRLLRGIPILALAALLGASLLAAPTAFALQVSGSPGLTFAKGCLDVNDGFTCNVSPTFNLAAGPNPDVSGSFDITGSTMTFSIDLASATLVGTDGPVTSVTFTDVTYSGSVMVDNSPGTDLYSILNGTATVSGRLTANGPDTFVDFVNASVNFNANCNGTPGSNFLCGFDFGVLNGMTGGFDVLVNGNSRDFLHTLNFSAVPEPGTALLLGLGLAGLASRRRDPLE